MVGTLVEVADLPGMGRRIAIRRHAATGAALPCSGAAGRRYGCHGKVSREKESDFETDFSGTLRTIVGGSYDFVFEAGRSVGIVSPGDAAPTNSLELTLRALRSIGTVSRVLAAGVPVPNGARAQYHEPVRHTYLAEVSSQVSQGAVERELRPGSISSGFSMSYVGRITGREEVLLWIFASLRVPPKFEVVGVSGNAIQLPEFRSRGIQVTQAVREGEILVLPGFNDRVVSSVEEGSRGRGTGSPAEPSSTRTYQHLPSRTGSSSAGRCRSRASAGRLAR